MKNLKERTFDTCEREAEAQAIYDSHFAEVCVTPEACLYLAAFSRGTETGATGRQ